MAHAWPMTECGLFSDAGFRPSASWPTTSTVC